MVLYLDIHVFRSNDEVDLSLLEVCFRLLINVGATSYEPVMKTKQKFRNKANIHTNLATLCMFS